MQYLIYELAWDNDFGFGPEGKATTLGKHMEATSFGLSEPSPNKILGFTNDVIDEQDFAEFSLVKVTESEALAFAQTINSEAYIDEQFGIVAPIRIR